MTIGDLLQQFLRYLEIDRKRSRSTVSNYDRCLQRFFAVGKIKTPSDISLDRVEEFRQYLNYLPGEETVSRVKSIRIKTQNYHLIAIRTFLKFLRERNISSLLPINVVLTKQPKPSLKIITTTELDRLRSVIKTTTIEGKRDQAIIELFISTGVRVSQLCALAVTDCDLERGEVSIRSHKSEVRVVGLSEGAVVSVQKYLEARQDSHETLFMRYGRKAHDGGDPRLSPRAIERMLSGYSIKAGITPPVTPQLLRHWCAVALLSRGTDLHSVQAHLGHAHSSSTKIYTTMVGYLRKGCDGE